MPAAQHVKFCPQCGCSTQRKGLDTPYNVAFTCGERIIVKADGTCMTSYTCHTVPGRMRDIERAIEDAVDCMLRGGIPTKVREFLDRAARSPGSDHHATPHVYKFLLTNKLAVRTPEKMRMRLTPLGAIYARRMQQMEQLHAD